MDNLLQKLESITICECKMERGKCVICKKNICDNCSYTVEFKSCVYCEGHYACFLSKNLKIQCKSVKF